MTKVKVIVKGKQWTPGDIKNLLATWLENWKTYIVLNGGTTNINPDSLGTLNLHLQTLKDNEIFCAEFYEPDLGDQLTAVTFIVDERVFAKDENKKYVFLEFEDWIWDNPNPTIIAGKDKHDRLFRNAVKEFCKNSIDLKPYYQQWVDYMGGEKNVFLRDFLKDFRLA